MQRTTLLRRADRIGEHRAQYEKNRKRVLASQTHCGICGKPVDKTLRWPNPLSATVDHIIPIDLGGHPSDMSNLQLAHMCCNRAKSNKMGERITLQIPSKQEPVTNRNLPLTMDWKSYRG